MANEIQKGSFVSTISESRTWLMGLAMISVILTHLPSTTIDVMQTHLPFIMSFPFSFFKNYGYYGVDVFFFLSGFGIWFSLRNNKQGGVMSFYTRRLWRIWPYCLVAGWVIFAITVAEQGKVHWVYSLLSLTGTNLWYIRSILIFYLLAPLLYKGIQFLGSIGRIPLLIGILLIITANILLDISLDLICPSPSFSKTIMHMTFARFPAFVLGMLLAWLGVEGGKKGINWWYWSAVLLGLAFVIAWHNNALAPFMPKWIWNDAIFLPMAVAVPSICALLAWCRSFVPRWVVKAVEWMGLYSLEIYLVHECVYGHIFGRPMGHYSLAILTAVSISLLAAFCLRKVTNFLLATLLHRTQA